jgi:hypothetical protein
MRPVIAASTLVKRASHWRNDSHFSTATDIRYQDPTWYEMRGELRRENK